MDRISESERMDIPERAQAYADADFSEVNAAFVERLCELAPAAGPLRALDLGTGPGDIPLLVGKTRPEWRIIAVDASRPMLRLATTARGDLGREARVHFALADAKRLPFFDSTFSVVFSNSLLHHLLDPMPLWKEICRVAEPRAMLFLRDLSRPDSPEAARAIVETHAAHEHPLLREDFYNSLLAAHTSEEIGVQLLSAGLEGLTAEVVSRRHLDVHGDVGGA